MIIKLSSDEMLAQWKLRRGFAPLRVDCMITRSDGVDLDELLRLEMRDWYLNLLSTAQVEMLATTNIADDIAIVPMSDGEATVMLPQNCRRIVEFQLEGWERPAIILTDASSREAFMQQNPFARGNSVQPIALKHGNRLFLYTVPQNQQPKITRAIAVMEPTDGSYEMDETALSTINKIHN